jgi:hypothetical protein
MTNNKDNQVEKDDYSVDQVMDKIKNAIGSIRFGTVTIMVQDGKVTQLECTEKIRIK